MCTRPRANRLLPSSTLSRGHSTSGLREGLVPPPDSFSAPSSNSSQSPPLVPTPTSRRRGEKSVCGGRGRTPSPPPQTSRGDNLTQPRRQPAAAPKPEGSRCHPLPDSRNEWIRPGGWFQSPVLGRARPLTHLRPPCWERERERKGPG